MVNNVLFNNSLEIIDISQEVLSCVVYPGDPKPELIRINNMVDGDLYNLSSFSMCAHNGTHVDAPAHFLKDGKTIEQLSLDAFVGPCFVAHHQGDVSADDAHSILDKAKAVDAGERILIAGDVTVTAEAASVFAKANIKLIGNEGQSVGPINAPMEVHLILLGAGIVLLEGIVLKNVLEGTYFISAAPLNLAGVEGAPCRAYLIKSV